MNTSLSLLFYSFWIILCATPASPSRPLSPLPSPPPLFGLQERVRSIYTQALRKAVKEEKYTCQLLSASAHTPRLRIFHNRRQRLLSSDGDPAWTRPSKGKHFSNVFMGASSQQFRDLRKEVIQGPFNANATRIKATIVHQPPAKWMPYVEEPTRITFWKQRTSAPTAASVASMIASESTLTM